MNEILINALQRQKVEVDQLLKLAAVSRAGVEEALVKHLTSPLIKVILGPRRAGKSTLAAQVLRGQPFAYVNLEDEVVLGALSESDLLIQGLMAVYPDAQFFLLYEVQNLPDWESFLNRQQRRGRNLLVTGSNSRLLSRELASALTGRHLAFELLPFRFGEFLSTRGIGATPIAEQSRSHFSEWLSIGGFPDVVLQRVDPPAYLRTLFDAILLRDVVTRHRIRNPAAIRALAQLLINSIAARFTARSLERALQRTAFSTIQKYLVYLEEAYLFFQLQAFSFKTRRRIASDKKIFTIDNGFISACSRLTLGGEAPLLENLVFVELLRRGHVPNLTLFYAQTKAGYEVDFFLPEHKAGPLLLQVSYSLADPITLERELRALEAAAREFRAVQLQIITFNEEASFERSGIKITAIPAWKWFLHE